ncbi:MAG: DUF4126 domain-containing protein [Actinobacteria bacterium]|nr:DUF4126 domain-containing protein [Actinomycetota bacterium]
MSESARPSRRLLVLAALTGLVSGGRSMTGPAAVASTTPIFGRSLGAVLARPGVRRPVVVAAATEYVLDKLPITPSRLSPAVLAARAVTGGIGGFAVARRSGPTALAGAGVAVAFAIGGSWLGARWRSLAAARFGDDLPGALAEDVVVLGLAAVLKGQLASSLSRGSA